MQRGGKSDGLWARFWAFVGSPFAGFGRPRRLAALDARVGDVRDDVRALIHVADEYRREGEIDRAVGTYWRAVHGYRRKGDELKALALLRRIVALATNDPSARGSLANCLEALGRRSEASVEFRAAAVLTQSAGRPNAAQRLWDRSERLCPLPRSVVEPDPLPDISEWPSIPDPADAQPVATTDDDPSFPVVILLPAEYANAGQPSGSPPEESVDIVVPQARRTFTDGSYRPIPRTPDERRCRQSDAL